jgi:aspartate/methionine/tyrosine aminotransferase
MSNRFPVSDHVAKMHSSSTLKAAQLAASLREEGHAVIDLTVGEPDFDTPEFIKKYAWEGLEKGITKYTSSAWHEAAHSRDLDILRTAVRCALFTV